MSCDTASARSVQGAGSQAGIAPCQGSAVLAAAPGAAAGRRGRAKSSPVGYDVTETPPSLAGLPWGEDLLGEGGCRLPTDAPVTFEKAQTVQGVRRIVVRRGGASGPYIQIWQSGPRSSRYHVVTRWGLPRSWHEHEFSWDLTLPEARAMARDLLEHAIGCRADGQIVLDEAYARAAYERGR